MDMLDVLLAELNYHDTKLSADIIGVEITWNTDLTLLTVIHKHI